ncbi:unnamed protein product [Symbiodinium natans]|uniref:Uncharacterized protein n=1 Tax=Symbiodinium natans TaxID=878477 RepID=A0A812G9V0_9DINO|nr:unnamed protein product [Symbiodinium natans]
MRQLRPGDTAKAHGDPPFKAMDAAGQELAPAIAPLEPPRTSLCDSLPVISEHPELSLFLFSIRRDARAMSAEFAQISFGSQSYSCNCQERQRIDEMQQQQMEELQRLQHQWQSFGSEGSVDSFGWIKVALTCSEHSRGRSRNNCSKSCRKPFGCRRQGLGFRVSG